VENVQGQERRTEKPSESCKAEEAAKRAETQAQEIRDMKHLSSK
jgi:hypothetical protein